jgi:hypothetical protein
MIHATGATQAAVVSAALQAPYCLKLGREIFVEMVGPDIQYSCCLSLHLPNYMCPSVKALGTRGYCGAPLFARAT